MLARDAGEYLCKTRVRFGSGCVCESDGVSE